MVCSLKNTIAQGRPHQASARRRQNHRVSRGNIAQGRPHRLRTRQQISSNCLPVGIVLELRLRSSKISDTGRFSSFCSSVTSEGSEDVVHISVVKSIGDNQ